MTLVRTTILEEDERRVMGVTKAVARKYGEDPVNINRAVLFGTDVFGGKKTVANINNTTVSAASHWSA